MFLMLFDLTFPYSELFYLPLKAFKVLVALDLIRISIHLPFLDSLSISSMIYRLAILSELAWLFLDFVLMSPIWDFMTGSFIILRIFQPL